MAVGGATAPHGASPQAIGRAAARPLEAGEVAWLIVVPCALVVAAIVLALGPALGSLAYPDFHLHFWASELEIVDPEPTEQARFLLALLAPVLASGAIVLAMRRGTWRASAATHAVVLGTQGLVLALLVAAVVRQHTPDYDYQISHPYFSWGAAVFAFAFALAFAAALAHDPTRARLASALHETPRRRWACLAAALLFAVVWLLTAINSDASVGSAHFAVGGLMPFTLNDVYAVLDGRSPLVDVHAQYSSLFPYIAAVPLLVFGSSLTVLTTFMAALTVAMLLAVYGVLRRVTRSSTGALALYLPLVAIGFYTLIGPAADRLTAANTFSWFPMRVGGPYLIAWLVARHLDGDRPRRTWPIFLVAGLAALNNLDLGLAALAGAVAALVWTRPPRSWREAGARLAEAALALAAALAAVAALTLIRTGSLPQLGLLSEFPRLYAVGGMAARPMPTFGFHYALYATYVAAIVVATVRTVGGRRDVLTGMLAWSGVFGLGAAGYFVGQSRYLHLIYMFPMWALALSLLLVVVVQAIAARGSHRAGLAELAVMAAFGLAVCALPQTPTPWSQVARIADDSQPALWRGGETEQFLAAGTTRGEHVAVLLPFGARAAYDLGLVDVSPYAHMELVMTREQLATTIRALRAEGGTRLYYWIQRTGPAAALARAGFEMTRYDQVSGLSEWTDRSGAG